MPDETIPPYAQTGTGDDPATPYEAPGDRPGQAQERFSQAQDGLGSAIDQAREFSDQLAKTARKRPLTTLLAVGAASFALGYLLRG